MTESALGAEIAQWVCMPCGHVYDPAQGDMAQGIPAGTPFEDAGEHYACPVCGVGKAEFERV